MSEAALLKKFRRVLTWAALLGCLGLAVPTYADAKAKREIERLTKEAMEHNDLLEYGDARRLLNQAIATAKKAKIESDPLVAVVHLNLGIVYFAGLNDPDSAKLAFKAALTIDPSLSLPAAYKTPEMGKAFDEVKSGLAPTPPPGGSGGTTRPPVVETPVEQEPAVDCKTIEGFVHDIVDEAPAGVAKRLWVHIGSDIDVDTVTLYARGQRGTYQAIKMIKEGACGYAASIPASLMTGDTVYYYISGFKGGDVVQSNGTSGAPNIMSVIGKRRAVVEPGPCDSDDPPPECFETGGDEDPSAKKVYLNIFAGTGGGYVSGQTEIVGSDIGCCFAPAYLHLAPELGFMVGDDVSLALAGRLGLTLGGNIPGQATLAPAGFVRIRFHTNGMSGVSFFGDVGGGIIRNVVKVVDQPSDRNQDLGAMGPLLVGGGASVHKVIGGVFRIGAELHVTAAIPVVDTLGSAPRLNFGVQTDVQFGIGLVF